MSSYVQETLIINQLSDCFEMSWRTVDLIH